MTITGRIGRDARMETTREGSPVMEFSIASNEHGDGDATVWVSVRSYNPNHFKLAQYLTKGKPIIVEGNYRDDLYKDKNGTLVIGRTISCTDIHFWSYDKREQQEQTHQDNQVRNPTISVNVMDQQPKAEPVPVNVPRVKVNLGGSEQTEDDDLPF